MRILVTGATGRLGRVLVPRLVEAGHTVRAMSRTSRAGAGVEWVRADLATGEGLAGAVAGVDAVAHLASAPYQRGYTRAVDVDGTGRLVAAASGTGAAHLLYASIVGIDRVPVAYFRHKLAAERLVRAGGVPWTILRITQFHSFVDEILGKLSRLPVLVTDQGIPAQPVDVREAGDLVAARLAAGPAGTEEFGGPEVLRGDAALRAWLRARGLRRPVLHLTVPGRLGRAFRSGALTPATGPTGRITWADYLSEVVEPRRASGR